ncbi:MAG TPA: BREX system ATP-binding domain-containing protein [Solirubrobacteraceae bacterium]|nr:BREX system ATP-binding domain-containing protein [Solirubrobacteraceae bacterium]
MLRGRLNEREVLDRQLWRVRSGESAVLVVRGEAGVGKTALLQYLAEQASGCRLIRVAGIESEMELAFAGLHQLCAPMLDRLDAVPGPQRDALRVSFGLQDGAAPNRFLVALAVLSLLAEAAEVEPLVCLVDDAQWLDQASAQTLTFVARRLLAERIAMVFAVRDPHQVNELSGLPELTVGGLDDEDARMLLASAMPGRLDEHVRDQIVAETRGNPLALLELPRGLTSAQLAGGFALAEARPLANHVEESFVERVRALPRETQRLLLVAAAEPVGDVSLLWRAAERLGIRGCASGPAEEAALIEVGIRVRFRHPLIRSAAYRAARLGDRQEVHRALADAIDPDTDPDRCAWHRAQAASEPDEDVAAALERSAERARARGGAAAAAAFLARAAELTPDPAGRGRRAVAAAQAKFDAAASDAALELLASAELAPLDELQRARLESLRAEIAFARTRGSEAPALLLDAARRLQRLDAAMARETHLQAIAAAMFAGRLADAAGIRDAAQAALAAPPSPRPARPIDLLLDGLATRFTDGYAAAVAPLREALGAFRRVEGLAPRDVGWLWLACRLAQDLWDDELWDALATQGVRVARDTGALTLLPGMANFLAALHVHCGAVEDAEELIDEVGTLTQAAGIPPLNYAGLMLAAWRGDQARMEAIADTHLPGAMARGEGFSVGMLSWMTALMHNGHGRYAEALAQAQRACEHDDVIAYGWALVELIEAGVRIGRRNEAVAALDRLSERTRARRHRLGAGHRGRLTRAGERGT